MLRRALRRRLYDRLVERATPLPDERTAAPAIVLAPHPDDETLGCGGLIARKRRCGVPVSVVFMTDGAASHPGDRAALRAQRREEAKEACVRLGVDPTEVFFLDQPDGRLREHAAPAAAELARIVAAHADHELVVPHPAEPPDDHAATYTIADEVLRRQGRDTPGVLYAVWLWDQWPYTNPLAPPRERSSPRAVARGALQHRFGSGLSKVLRHRLDIGEVLPAKRAALDAHASQMRRDHDAQPTLPDVAGGEWLDLLLRPQELYGLGRLGATG